MKGMASIDAYAGPWIDACNSNPLVGNARLSKSPLTPMSSTMKVEDSHRDNFVSTEGMSPYSSTARREVRLRLRVSDIFSIDLPSRCFTISFALEVHWDAPPEEHRLIQRRFSLPIVEQHSSDEARNADFHNFGAFFGVENEELWEPMFPFRETGRGARLWTPKLNFDNCLDLHSDADRTWQVFSGRNPENSGCPEVCFKLRGTGTFRARFELHQFPMDAQDLRCIVVSKRVSSELNLVPHPSASHIFPQDKFLLRDEFELVQCVPAVSKVSDPEESSGGKLYPQIYFTIKVVRRPNYYWHVVYVPLFLFVLCSFCTLLLEVHDFKERLGLLFTLWLAAIAHSNVFTQDLPKVSYLTDLDKYVLGCNFILVAIIFESVAQFALAPYISPSRRDLLGKFEDEILMPGCVILWCVVHVSFYRRYDVGKFNSLTTLEQEGIVSYHEGAAHRKAVDKFERWKILSPKNATQQSRGDERVKERLQRINDHLCNLRRITSSEKQLS